MKKDSRMMLVLFVFSFVNILLVACMSDQINVKRVVITQIYYLQGSKNEKIIFDGSSNQVKELLAELKKAKKIPLELVIKEALIEGEYKIELYMSGGMVKTFFVINSRNIYDEDNNQYYYCPLLQFIPNRN